jgi:hypothetical protein
MYEPHPYTSIIAVFKVHAQALREDDMSRSEEVITEEEATRRISSVEVLK